VSAPVLFLRGGESPVVPDAALVEVAAANPVAVIASVPRSGHMVPIENLHGFIEAVLARHGFVTGRGFPAAQDEQAMRDEWAANGAYRFDDPLTDREESVARLRHWLDGQESGG
jgi:hypothetical protein